MQSFIVLGIIPGTDLQLNFGFWLTVWLGLISLPLLRALWRRRPLFQAYFVGAQLVWFIDRSQLSA